MQAKGAQPTVPTGPTPNAPIPPIDISDMDRIHNLVTSGKLADVLTKLGKKK